MTTSHSPHLRILAVLFLVSNLLPFFLYYNGPVLYESSPSVLYSLFYLSCILFSSFGLLCNSFDCFLLTMADRFILPVRVSSGLTHQGSIVQFLRVLIILLVLGTSFFCFCYILHIYLFGAPFMRPNDPYSTADPTFLSYLLFPIVSFGYTSSCVLLPKLKSVRRYRRFLPPVFLLNFCFTILFLSSYYPSRSLTFVFFLTGTLSFLFLTDSSFFSKLAFSVLASCLLFYSWSSITSVKAAFEDALDVPSLLESVWRLDTGFAFAPHFLTSVSVLPTSIASPCLLLVGYLVHTFWLGGAVFKAYLDPIYGLNHPYFPVFSAYWFVGLFAKIIHNESYRYFTEGYIEWGQTHYPSSYRSWYGNPARVFQDFGFFFGLIASFLQGLLFRLLLIFSFIKQPINVIRLLSTLLLYIATFFSLATGLWGQFTLVSVAFNLFGLGLALFLRHCLLIPLR